MEKDNFKDRTTDTTMRSKNRIGDYVLVCEKHMQKDAKKIKDLTYGRIVQLLTSKDVHPRGIKVKIIDINGQYHVGRIVYKIKNGKIERKI